MSTRFSSKGQLSPEGVIPEKLYFKIGEVSQLVGVQPHVLRYWEKEVSAIRPGKTASNQRRYRRKDVEVFREIRRLLYEEKFTLAGARKRLSFGEKGDEGPETASSTDVVPAAASDAVALGQVGQLKLEFQDDKTVDRLLDIREGLVDLIRFVGEET
jgi:DNA-binding transcriptional MerR regulator